MTGTVEAFSFISLDGNFHRTPGTKYPYSTTTKYYRKSMTSCIMTRKSNSISFGFRRCVHLEQRCNQRNRQEHHLMMISEVNQFNLASFSLASVDYATPTQTFEPEVNAPALFAFAIISFVFSLLMIRINQVRDASIKREEALALLRQVKSEQLDSSSRSSAGSIRNNNELNENKTIESSKATINDEVKNAIKAYEDALKEELSLRTIIPGVRIAAPNDAARREEDIAAAKQFLDWDIMIDDEDSVRKKENEPQNIENDQMKKMNLLMESRRRFDGENDQDSSSPTSSPNNMSSGGKAILLAIALSQIVLLVFLSLDPMSANHIFDNVVGDVPDEIPLSKF